MFEGVDARTDGRTPARVPSYKLTLWAFSSELKIGYKSKNKSDIFSLIVS